MKIYTIICCCHVAIKFSKIVIENNSFYLSAAGGGNCLVAVCNQCLSREVKRVRHRFGACICIKKGSSFFFSCILKEMKGLSTDAVLLLSLSPVLVLLPISHFLSSGIHSPMAL